MPSGSKWMSEAPFLDALRDHAVDELDDGRVAGGLADLGDLAEVAGLLLVLLDRLGDRGVELARVASAASMSSADATAGRTSSPVMIEMSSTARTLVGSDIATISVSSPMKATGIAP